MSRPIIGRYGGGKTTFSLGTCFVARTDRLVACAWLGGTNASMERDAAANSLRIVATRFSPGSPQLEKLIASGFVQKHNRDEVKLWIRGGLYQTYYEGLWFDPLAFLSVEDCQFVSVRDAGEQACEEPDYLFGFFTRFNRTQVVAMTHVDRIAAGPTSKTFAGLPYIRVGESAVRSPIGFGMFTNPNGIGHRIVGQILSDVTRLEEAVSAYQQSGFGGSLQEYVLYEVNPDIFTPRDHAVAAGEMLQAVRATMMSDSKRIGSPIHISDRIGAKHGVVGRSCLGNLFGLPRCIIDSITTIVLSASGNALSNGLPAGFMEALADTTESEAIWLYTPSSLERDPLINALVGGYVDGFVFSDKSTWRRFEKDARYAVSTRNRDVESRFDRFLLADGERVIGNTCWLERASNTVHDFGKEYSSRYDSKLRVFSANGSSATEYNTIILPKSEDASSTFEKSAAAESREASLTRLLCTEGF